MRGCPESERHRIAIDGGEPGNDEQIAQVARACKRRYDLAPPHLFALAHQIYRPILETRQDQLILLMGHAGAGKRFNAESALGYLFKAVTPPTPGVGLNFKW